MATLIPAIGEPRTIRPANGRTFTAPELQQLVGGWLEALRTPDGGWLFINEEGKLQSLPLNRLATVLMARRLPRDDYIVGDVVVCNPLEAGEGEDEDDADEPDEADAIGGG